MSDLVKSLRDCADGHCDEHCISFYLCSRYGKSCKYLLVTAANALEEWEKHTAFLAAHGMLKEE